MWQRLRVAAIDALPLVFVTFLFDWAGSRGALLPWGDPRPFTEVLTRLPLWYAGVMAVYLWWKKPMPRGEASTMTRRYSFGFEEPSTYFGLYSAIQRDKVIDLLRGLDVRFEFVEVAETEQRLRDWTAWDASSAASLIGYELWITSADLDRVGTKIVELYPERKFDNG